WGTSVTTTGYGSLAEFGGDKNQRYTSSFNGTSSATPIVAATAAVLQEYAGTTYGMTLTPLEMRTILMDTGTPQSDPANGNIGPLPNIQAALAEIDDLYGCPWNPGDWNYCRDCGPCGEGEGDCEPGECESGLVCATDVGPNYGWPSAVDVCELPAPTCPWSPGDWNYCRDCGPCGQGEGDCEPGECASGLVCATDVGPNYGWPSAVDVCEQPSGPQYTWSVLGTESCGDVCGGPTCSCFSPTCASNISAGDSCSTQWQFCWDITGNYAVELVCN
ncbi:MAG: S8 family serine peptidase, partial [Myxococcota bacterium]